MKARWKYFLLGAAAALTGVFLYAGGRDTAARRAAQAAVQSFDRAYIAHRRRLIRQRAKERACGAPRPPQKIAPLPL